MATQFIPPGGIPSATPVGTAGDTLATILEKADSALQNDSDISGNTFKAALATISRSLADYAGDVFNIKDYGVKADGLTLTDGVIASGSTSLSSASYQFTSDDVGKIVLVPGGDGFGYSLNTKISSVASGVATLASSASTAVSGTVIFGTDDTASWNGAISIITKAGNATIFFPSGLSLVTGSIIWKSGLSLHGAGSSVSVIKYVNSTDMTSAVISGLSGSASSPYSDCHFTDFAIDCDAAVQSTYSVAGKAFYIQYMRRALFRDLYIHGSPATGLGCDFMDNGIIYGNTVENCGRLNNGTAYGGAGIGIGVGGMESESYITIGNNVRGNGRFGIFYETQNSTPSGQAKAITQGNSVILNRAGTYTNANGTGIADSGLTGHICVGNFVQCDNMVGSCIAINAGSLGYSGIKGGISENHVIGANQSIVLGLMNDASAYGINNYVVNSNYIEQSSDVGILIKGSTNFATGGLFVYDNFILNTSSSAILLDANSASTMVDVSIKNNKIKDCNLNQGQESGSTWRGGAIQVTNAVTCNRLTISGNDVFCTNKQTSTTQGTQYFLVNAGNISSLSSFGNTWYNTYNTKPMLSTGSTLWLASDSFPLVFGVQSSSATGTTLATAAQLIGRWNNVTSATASSAIAVSLPTLLPEGSPVTIVNSTSISLSVFPDTSARSINNGTAGDAVSLAAGASITLIKAGSTWLTVV